MENYLSQLRTAMQHQANRANAVIDKGVMGNLSEIAAGEKEMLGDVSSQSFASWKELGKGNILKNPARALQQAVGGALAVFNMPVDLANNGLAVATNFVSEFLAPMPAATMGSLFVAPPHGHMHPPSFAPPAIPAPVPLPSLGAVLLGTAINVLIRGVPAARAGDIGLAITCVGFSPMFEIFLGSSKVFVGGTRAARMLDMCKGCIPGAGALDSLGKIMKIAGTVVSGAGIVGDVTDAVETDDSEMAAAKAMAAGMGVASMAADAAAAAISAALGTDPAVPPSPGLLTLGTPTVLIGGFPMINIPNPVEALLRKVIGRKVKRAASENPDEGEVEPHVCPVGGR